METGPRAAASRHSTSIRHDRPAVVAPAKVSSGCLVPKEMYDENVGGKNDYTILL